MAIYFPSLTLHKQIIAHECVHVNELSTQTTTIGERLRAERKRLGHSQTQFAELAGVHKNAQGNYESDLRRPDADYLVQISAAGVDVLYVLTGERNTSTLSADEANLVQRYREAPDAVKAAAVAALTVGAAPAKYQQDFTGANIGQQVSGDVTGPFTIDMRGSSTSGEARKKRK